MCLTLNLQYLLISVTPLPGIPYITIVGLSLDTLAPFLPGFAQLPVQRGNADVEFKQFSWTSANAAPRTSQFRWMRAEDGRCVT